MVKTATQHSIPCYFAFTFILLFVPVHETHGLALLYCTRTDEHAPHYQLPGGIIDETDFMNAARSSDDAYTQLLLAAQLGAARELLRETGVDMRDQLHRLEPAGLRSEVETVDEGKHVMTCELDKNLYFFLSVGDADFWSKVRCTLLACFVYHKNEADLY